jgi:hypothetical protein
MTIQKIFVTGDSFGSGAGLASESLFPSENIFAQRFTRSELQKVFEESGYNIIQTILPPLRENLRKNNPALYIEQEEKKESYCSVIEKLTGIPSHNISSGGGSLQSIAYNVFDKMSGEDNLENTLLIINLTALNRQMIPNIQKRYTNILPAFKNTNHPEQVEEFYNKESSPYYYAITALMAIKSIVQFATENKIQCYYIDSYLYETSIKFLQREGGKSIGKIIDQLPTPDLLVYPGLISHEDKVWMPCGHHDHSVQIKIANKIIQEFSLV